MKRAVAISVLMCVATMVLAAPVTFTTKPKVKKKAHSTSSGQGASFEISFAVSKKTDVEVAVVNASGKVVRHLAGGIIGTGKVVSPLKPGLEQALVWDMKDDFGKAVPEGDYSVRVRAGMDVKFGRHIGEDPYTFGSINSLTTDEDGRLYVTACRGGAGQNLDVLRAFNSDGGYYRTLIPFPADLKPEAITKVAEWNETRKGFITRNRRSQLPNMYPWGSGMAIISSSKKGGIVLTHGTQVYRLDQDGSNLQGPFPMWGKAAKLKNPRWNIPQLAVSPDGRYIYYSNVAGTRYRPKGYKDFDPKWPQGRVYRQDSSKEGEDPQKFYDLELPDYTKQKYWLPDAWKKRTAAYGITTDAKGHLYICDLVNQGIVEVSPEGKKISFTKAPWPERIHVDPKTGDYYVISRYEAPRDGYVPNKLVKITGRGESGAIAFEMSLKKWRGMGAATALGIIEGKPMLWVGGGGALICVKDNGTAFEIVETKFKKRNEAQADWNRIVVDYERDEVYTSNGVNKMWRYNGKTGEGEFLKVKGKPFYGVDVAVGYDGLLYCRTGKGYSGPLERYTRELAPAPYEGTGSHVLSKLIYSRFGVGNCEKGLGVGPKNETYINFMYGWNKYFIAGFGGDGKPLKGNYLDKKVGNYARSDKDKAKGPGPYPLDLDSAIVGPIPSSSGGIRVDLQGNIYLGLRVKPAGFKAPAGFEKSPAYANWTGSIVKFSPKGGCVIESPKKGEAVPPPSGIVLQHGNRKMPNAGVLAVYPGIGPLSGSGWGGGSSCCVCRVPRFGVDRYGRLCFANAVTHSVVLMDNAGNLIKEFGNYGNFDSQYVNPELKGESSEGKPTVSVPELPLAWPTGCDWSDTAIYVNDTYNRRVMRADKTWQAAETVAVK